MIIGICGPSGSGKTYYSKKYKQQLESSDTSVIVIHIDNFYKGIKQYNKNQIDAHKKGILSYDEPDMIDIEYLIHFLKCLQNGEHALMPVYDFSLYDRLSNDKWITIKDKYDIIIVEGLFAFYYKELRDMFECKIYMGTPESICSERRLNRNTTSRIGPDGKNSKEYEIEYYNKYVYPSYKKYIEPLKQYADIIL